MPTTPVCETYDVIVVGGGPGGSTTASFIAMRGHSVLLLEREAMPRYQIGESLLPATVHGICRMLGVFDDIVAAGFIRKNGAAFRWGTKPDIWTFGFSQAPLLERLNANFAFQVERSVFDKLLLDNARRKGVVVRERHNVDSLVIDDERVVGVNFTNETGKQGAARARFVVDASGNSSHLHPQVGKRSHSEFFRNLALFGYFEDGKRLPEPNQGNILCEAFDNGWMWYIPLRSGPPTLTSVGVVAGKTWVERIRDDSEGAYREAIDSCPKIKQLLVGARRVDEGQYAGLRTRRDWTYTNERFWIPGFVLVGDAACFLDPVLSTGVHLATYAGLLAARSINAILGGKVEEPRALNEFEFRYRVEYRIFLNYLIAFYDMHRDESSYYWSARKVIGTSERANEAFVRLVSGSATGADVYFQAKEGVGDVMQAFADDLDMQLPLAARSEISYEMAKRVHEFEVASGGASPVHPGAEDLRRTTWGKDPLERGQVSPAATGFLTASSDGLAWECD